MCEMHRDDCIVLADRNDEFVSRLESVLPLVSRNLNLLGKYPNKKFNPSLFAVGKQMKSFWAR